jgi:hypothetical protein
MGSVRSILLALVAAALLAFPLFLSGPAGCFEPKLPDVAFRCGENDECPEDYECRADGCCHRIGSPPDAPSPCTPDEDAAVSQDASG